MRGRAPSGKSWFRVCVCVCVAIALRCGAMRCVRAAAAARANIKHPRLMIPRIAPGLASLSCSLSAAPSHAGGPLARAGVSQRGGALGWASGWAGGPWERLGGGRREISLVVSLYRCGVLFVFAMPLRCDALQCVAMRCGAMRVATAPAGIKRFTVIFHEIGLRMASLR